MSPLVPRVELAGKRLDVPLRLTWSCHCCAHRVSALSVVGVQAAMDDHAAFINATADQATDPHFEESRLDALICV